MWFEMGLAILPSTRLSKLFNFPKPHFLVYKIAILGASLVVQWLRLHSPNAGGPGLISGQGTGSHMLQVNIPHVTTKTSYKYINRF